MSFDKEFLNFVFQVLHTTDFSAKSVSKFSVRPLDLTCCLKADPTESGYLKAVSENGFECILGACSAIATELAFPEIVCPTLIHLKSFLKKECKNGEVTRKYKTLIDKVNLVCTYNVNLCSSYYIFFRLYGIRDSKYSNI